jgi:hypothetical protein
LTEQVGVKTYLRRLASHQATCGHGAMHHPRQWAVALSLVAVRHPEQLLAVVAV